MARKTTEAQKRSAMELLHDLRQQHAELGECLATITERVDAEVQVLKAQAKTSAAELDECRIELVDLRAALETEAKLRLDAEALAARLEETVRRMATIGLGALAVCNPPPEPSKHDASGDNPHARTAPTLPSEPPATVVRSSSAAEAAVLVEVAGDVPAATSLSELLRIGPLVLAALDTLVVMEGAAGREDLVRNLLLERLERVGLLPGTLSVGGGPEVQSSGADPRLGMA